MFPNNWLSEISGSFGDMGTLLPILVSLSATGQISLSASLIFGGVFNIISGYYFRIPMCVQPMKSIAAIALLANLSTAEIASAGLTVSLFLLFFAVTGLVKVFNNYIPLCVIRGIQLGTGLTLISKGIQSVISSKGWDFLNQDWKDNNLIAMLAFLVVLFSWRARWNFSAIFLFLLGLVIASTKTSLQTFTFGPTLPTPFVPSAANFWTGFIKAGLGQLPLSLSNSVIAVAALADDLFPLLKSRKHDVTTISIWLASMNLISAWFGSLPYCCGSGGLAAQYRFGARTGWSVIILGFLKLLAGLLFGNSLTSLFKQFPKSIIGILLIVAGLQIALVTVNLGSYKSVSKRENAYLVMILTATAIVGFANDGIGFLIGSIAAAIIHYTNLDTEDIECAISGQETTVVTLD